MEISFVKYIFEPATNLHKSEIQNLIFSVLIEYGLKPGTIDRCLEDIEFNYFNNGGFFGIVFNNLGQIIATGGLYKINDKSAEVRKMYIMREFRGKGIGKFILSELIKIAKKNGFSRLELETAAVLTEAISLYKKFGFQIFDSKKLAERCDQAFELII
ncbi:MAG: GNAT family N-acetyltransferase [Saprospiraceae bacterium]|nr:GNAT family N-acetyltransferase [Saprospiraceae bacterium]